MLPIDALDSARVAGPAQDPPVLSHLRSREPRAFDVELEVTLRTQAMRDAAQAPRSISRTNLRSLYWDPAQHIAHATSNGASLRTGDLYASGTVSAIGPEASAA